MKDVLATTRADLDRAGSELSEVTRLVTELERTSPTDRTLTFGIAGNVTTDLLEIYLRKQAVLHGHAARVVGGGFDNPLGSAKQFVREGADAVIFLNLADAILPAFEARIPTLGAHAVDELLDAYRGQLSLTLTETRDVKHVFVADVHRLAVPGVSHMVDPVDAVISRINNVIREEADRAPNVRVIATGNIAAQIGWDRAHDWRSYERFRAPFTPEFMDRLALAVYRSTRGFGTYYYKALALDCDNTLWGGILGEDLPDGLKLGPHGYPGSVFWRVQHELLALQQMGVLLCLCSKNNAADVEAVLATHPEMVLRDEHLAAKAVNWDSKVTNLTRLAEQLNIGLDAFVFLDDSPFECEAVRNQLPMVKTIQVPDPLSAYPAVVAGLRDLFMVDAVSSESAAKTEQYRLLAKASLERGRHASEAAFLASLGLTVTIRRNDPASALRVSELTLKSNQFNLTTRRYTVAEITSIMESDDNDVYSIHVADKFGDSGLTGVIIIRYDTAQTAAIDTFLLSCRVLGRGVETSVWAEPLAVARAGGRTALLADYIPTPKNGQVRDLWDRLGLALLAEAEDGHRTYRADLVALNIPAAPHIEVINVV